MNFKSESDVIQQQQQPITSQQQYEGPMIQCHRDARAPSSPSSSSPPSIDNKRTSGQYGDEVSPTQHPASSSSSSSSSTSPPSSSSLSSLSSSSQKHGGPSIIKCSICSKTFNNSSALAKHKLIHSDERKYACPRCNKSFKRQDHLNGHMMTHAEQKPFRCQFGQCEKSYCDNRSLRRHYENHHQHQLIQQQQQKNSTTTSNLPDSAILTPGLTPRSAGPLSGEGTVFNFENIDLRRYNLAQTDVVGGETWVTSVPPSPSTFSQLQMSPVSPAVGQQIFQEATPIFPFNEPKPVVCTDCGKRFKNTPALNGHMRLHGGYRKPSPEDKSVSSAESKLVQLSSKKENSSPSFRHDDSSTLSSPPSSTNLPYSASTDALTNFSNDVQNFPEQSQSPDVECESTGDTRIPLWSLSDSSEFVERPEDNEKDMIVETSMDSKQSTSNMVASFLQEKTEYIILQNNDTEHIIGDKVHIMANANASLIQSDKLIQSDHNSSDKLWQTTNSLLINNGSLPVDIWLNPKQDDLPGNGGSVFSDGSKRVESNVQSDDAFPSNSQEFMLDDDQVIDLLYTLDAKESSNFPDVSVHLQPGINFGSDIINQALEATPSKNLNVSDPSNNTVCFQGDSIFIPIEMRPPEDIFRPTRTTSEVSSPPISGRGRDTEGFSCTKDSSFPSLTNKHDNLMNFTIEIPSDQFIIQETEEPATPSLAFQQKCSLKTDEPVFLFPNASFSLQNQSYIINPNEITSLLMQRREGFTLVQSQASLERNNVVEFENRRRTYLGNQEIDLLSSGVTNRPTDSLIRVVNSIFEAPHKLTDSQVKELHLKKLDDDKRQANQVIDDCLIKLKAEDMQRNSLLNSAGIVRPIQIDESNLILVDGQAFHLQNVQQQNELVACQLVEVGDATYLVPGNAFQKTGDVRDRTKQEHKTVLLLSDAGFLNFQPNHVEVNFVCPPEKTQQAFVALPSQSSQFDGTFSGRQEDCQPSFTLMLDNRGIPERSKRKAKPQPLTIPFSDNNYHSQGGSVGGIKRPSSPQKSVPSPRRLKSSHSPMLASSQFFKVIPRSTGVTHFSRPTPPPQSAPPCNKDFTMSLYTFDIENDLEDSDQ